MIFNISVIIIVILTIIYIYNRKASLKEGLAGCTIVDFSANVVAGTGIPSTVDFNVVAVGTNTIMHSTDSGETWSSGSASALHLKAAAMSGSNAIAVGTNTIMYSTNGGNTWSSGAASALHLKGVGISDTNAVAVGTNTILYSLNGGQTWSSGAASALHLMDAAISGLNAVAVGTNTILYSKDAGKTWSSGAASALHLKGVAISGSNAVAVGTNTILYSTDAGKTWSSAAASALHLKAVAISGPNVIAVGTNTILYSQDGGKTWNSGSASALHLTSVAISGSKAVAVGTNTILYSTDAGQTWSSGSASALHLTGVAFGGPAQVIPCSKNMTLQPGNSCMLKPKCSDSGQNPVSGTPVSLKYSCDANGLLKPPVAVKCTSGTQPCTIPSIPAHSTGTTTNCKKGGILQPNGVCAVKCDVGYVGDGGTFQYKCSPGGSTFSQLASVKCNQTCSGLPSFPHNNMIPTTNVPSPAPPAPAPPAPSPPSPTYISFKKNSHCLHQPGVRSTSPLGTSLADAEEMCNKIDSCAYIDRTFAGKKKGLVDFYKDCDNTTSWSTRNIYKKVPAAPL